MSQIIAGITFSVSSTAEGESVISVVSKPDACKAVEFLAETIDGSWASEVTALRPGISIRIPAPRKASVIKIRMFNDIGKELNLGGDSLLEFAKRDSPPQSSVSNSSGSRFLMAAIIAAVFSGGYYLFASWSAKPPQDSVPQATAAGPSIAILARTANLRSAPLLDSTNIVSALPFGTQLIPLGQSGDFLEVQVFGGSKGFVHKNTTGDAGRVQALGLRDALEQARSVQDNRRTSILTAARAIQPSIVDANILSPEAWTRLEPTFSAAIAQTTGDDVAGRYFHYLAEEANRRRNMEIAVVYFRAAALSNPLSTDDVHGWGITQILLTGKVDETAMLHAAVLAPQTTNTWLMVASHLSMRPAEVGTAEVVQALRVAASFSTSPTVTKRYFTKLVQTTPNAVLKAALGEVVSEM
jgi:hypothetical protein